ncbi:MAG: AAA family ATPase [Candidatus Thorarchaeota archaeon]
MRIERVIIGNFGPFYKEHEIQFSDKGYGIHIIRGNTGQGKTSIQRAILWCIYGQVVDRKNQPIPPTSLINRTAVKDDIYQFYVKLFFYHEDEFWSIHRKMQGKTHTDRSYNSGMGVQVVKEGEIQSNPEHVICRLIPPDVSRFYFFDGEMLSDYEELLEEDTSSMRKLRDSVERILGIPYLKIARDDVKEVNKKFESERTKLLRRLKDKDYSELASDLTQIIREIEEREKRIKKLEEDMNKLDVEISDKKRRQSSIKEIEKLVSERDGLENKIRSINTRKERLSDQLKTLTTNLYKSIMNDIAVNIIKKLESEHERVMKRYDTKQKLKGQLEELEKSKSVKKCRVCGRELTPEVLREIEQKREEIEFEIEELTEVPEPNLEFEKHAETLKRMVSQEINRSEFTTIENEMLKLDHDEATLKARLSQISEELAGSDIEEPSRLERDIQNACKEYGRLEQSIKGEEEKKRKDLEKKNELEQIIKSIPKEEIKHLEEKISMTSGIHKIFEYAIDDYRNKKRKEVEKKATDIFQRIIEKSSFLGLRINDNFGLSIETNADTILNKAEWRSAGEEQVVALSLIGALNDCANISAPVFMDTPFGRLDTQHGRNVLSFLPEMSEQVVLLVTDREFRKEDEEVLTGKIKTDLTVSHLGEEEGSRVVHTQWG